MACDWKHTTGLLETYVQILAYAHSKTVHGEYTALGKNASELKKNHEITLAIMRVDVCDY